MTNYEVQRWARLPLLIFTGTLLMQIAWICALPPFRGIDEFDHAFRAAAVSSGQWMPTFDAAKDGRGDLVIAPRSLVQDARPVCETLDYTGPDNCRPVRQIDDEHVLIATAAGRYHPAFYWLIAVPASPFEGSHALYAMRLTAAVLCAGFVALAAWSASQWARTAWPYLGLLIALSPVAIYSTALPAPNGVEISAALALWTALLGLTGPRLGQLPESRLLWSTLPALLVVTTVRQLGPLLFALTVCTFAIMCGKRRLLELLVNHRRPVAFLATAGLLSCVANVWWISTADSLTPEPSTKPVANATVETLSNVPLWLLQTIAAFPGRTEVAPAAVYGIWLMLFIAIVATCLLYGVRRARWTLILAIAIATTIPLVLSLMTIVQAGPIWQGRYGLPYAVGVPLIATLAMDRDQAKHSRLEAFFVIGAFLAIVAHAMSAENAVLNELRSSPLSGDPRWLVVHPWLPALAMMLGGAVWLVAIGRQSRTRNVTSREMQPLTAHRGWTGSKGDPLECADH